jgi:hypothetical protein
MAMALSTAGAREGSHEAGTHRVVLRGEPGCWLWPAHVGSPAVAGANDDVSIMPSKLTFNNGPAADAAAGDHPIEKSGCTTARHDGLACKNINLPPHCRGGSTPAPAKSSEFLIISPYDSRK